MFYSVMEKYYNYLIHLYSKFKNIQLISVGRLYINESIPKMEEVEKELATAHGGWVSNGGCWKPTECKARVKVRYLSKCLLFYDLRN